MTADPTDQERLGVLLRQCHGLLEGSDDLFSIADGDYRYVWVNRAYRERYGLMDDAIEGRALAEVLGADHFERIVKPRMDRCLAGEPQRYETERYHPGLGWRKLLVRYVPIVLPDPPEPRIGAVITDVTDIHEAETALARQSDLLDTERKLQEEQLRAARDQAEDREMRYRVLAEYSPNWDYWMGVDGIYHYMSPACEAICGYPAAAFMADPELMEQVIHPNDRPLWRDHLEEINSAQVQHSHQTIQLRVVRPDGAIRWIAHDCAPAYDQQGRYLGRRGVNRDITERKRAEQQLERIAFEDPLTKIYTRSGFARQLQQCIDQEGWPRSGAVAMVDIISLRDVNDTFGFKGGDQVLIEFGRRLQAQAGQRALAGRIAGDEFTLYLQPHADETLETGIERLVESLSAPLELDGVEVQIAIRLGYTRMGEHKRPSEDLMHEAEAALFHSRTEPSAPWVAYTNRIEDERTQRVELTREMREALEKGQFELHFQPQVDLATGRVVSCEALLRWNHPEKGLIPPGLFIPIAEQSQLIGPIGDWVLRRACQHLRDWRDAGLKPVRVSVNVSLIQFQIGDFVDRVRTILEEFGVDPAELALEITESVFERQSEILLEQMLALHDMGIWLSLDDFGTGYSSLTYLQRYPFDEIKIDQAFVFGLLDDAFSRQIVETVLVLAQALGSEAVAEGIESSSVSDKLQAMGCRIGQGYYYSMPLEAEDFRWLLEQRSALPLAANHSN